MGVPAVEGQGPDPRPVRPGDTITAEQAHSWGLVNRLCEPGEIDAAVKDLAERLAALGAAVKDNPGSFNEEKARAEALLESKQFYDAAQAYTNLLARFPEAAGSDAIQLRLGKSLLGARQPAQAVAPLARVSEASAEMKAEALFNQAEALRRSNRAGESGLMVDRLMKQYGKSRWAQDALYNLGRALKTLRIESPDPGGRRWIGRSPAMAAGLTDHIWQIEELLSTLPLPATNT